MKIVGYQIFLRITRFVILVIRPDYQKFCLRSTPEEDELVHITSGVVASFDVQNDTRTAHDMGEAELIKLCEQRMQTGKVGLFESMKKLKINTFTKMSTMAKSKVRGQEILLKADRNLLARLVVIGRFRKIDLQELLTYSLGPLPLPLASATGCLVKTNKANLLHALENQAENPVGHGEPKSHVGIRVKLVEFRSHDRGPLCGIGWQEVLFR